MNLPMISQRGASQILLPLFLIAAIGLTVYIAQQRTNLTPFAQQSSGCAHLNPNPESSFPAATTINSNAGNSGSATPKSRSQKATSQGFVIRYEWSDGRVSFDFKDQAGRLLKEKGYSVRGSASDCTKIAKRSGQNDVTLTGSSTVITAFEDGTVEFNKFTAPDSYDPASSYAECCNKNYQFSQGTNFTASTTGSGKSGDSCTKSDDCQSGTCTNQKCSSNGSKVGGDSCQNGPECQSGTCSNNKCDGGSRSSGQACDTNKDCASNKCNNNNKCENSSSSNNSNSNNSNNNSGNNSNPTSSPSPSSAPSASASTSPSPLASASGSGGTTPISLTKAEITGFKTSFDALYARLGTTKDSGNLKIVSGIANTELTSIVSQLSTCPDDANVGTCLDSKFRTRFDFAKTAARLSAFYAIFNNVQGICVKSDFGLNPLINATSTTSASGRVNLCNDSTTSTRVWKVFVNNKFEDLISTDTRFPKNPTCAALPSTDPTNVLSHYRNAETLFNTQTGFVQNTLCDGKTLVAPEGSASPAP